MAEQLEFFPVQSPCRGICQTDERGYCRGCFRSREERFNWQTMSDAQKQEVLRLCRQRLLRKIRANRPEPAEEQAFLFHQLLDDRSTQESLCRKQNYSAH